ncbi:MAG TPA: uroporphyrinogen-III synthase [Candidatus Polarisedimenticolia bacterium]|nr:uroporphyrinogen-III synthase [Candidatus Polarisedimenticolia bacterium]
MPTARRPLHGRTIVVTRATEQAGALARRLRGAGARVLEAPAIAFAPPRSWSAADRALEGLDRFDLLLFTSVNGVVRFLERARRRSGRREALRRIPVVAIGPATAAAARRGGLRVRAVPRQFRAEGLVRLLRGLGRHRAAEAPSRGHSASAARPRGLGPARILMPRAAAGRDVVLRALRRRGARVTVIPVYRTVPSRRGRAPVARALRTGRIDLVTFASAATARHFAAAFAGPDRRRLRRVPAAVIGPITAREARRLGFRIAAMPARATIPDLARAIARALRS